MHFLNKLQCHFANWSSPSVYRETKSVLFDDTMNFLSSKKESISINGQTYRCNRQKPIGEGAFAFVYKAKYTLKSTKFVFALKIMICMEAEQLEEAKKEINELKRLNHDNILRLEGHLMRKNKKNQDEVLLLMPFYRKGTIEGAIFGAETRYPRCPFTSLRTVRRIFCNLVDAVDYMHSMGVRHNDIKTGNLLLRDDMSVVLSDFGSVSALETVISSRKEALLIMEDAASHTTASIRAPELFDCPSNIRIDGKADVWSIGCTLYAILYSKTPFESEKDGLSSLAVLSGTFVFPPAETGTNVPHEFCEIISDCLRPNATERLGISTLKARVLGLPDRDIDLSATQPTLLAPPTSEVMDRDSDCDRAREDGSMAPRIQMNEDVKVAEFTGFADFEDGAAAVAFADMGIESGSGTQTDFSGLTNQQTHRWEMNCKKGSYTVRVANKEDAERIMSVTNEAFMADEFFKKTEYVQRFTLADVQKLMGGENACFLIAETSAGATIGSIFLSWDFAENCKKVTGHFSAVSVTGAWERCGIGRGLVGRAEDYITVIVGVNCAVREMEMGVINLREDLFPWYEKQGYRRKGEMRGDEEVNRVTKDGMEVYLVFMGKELGGSLFS